MVRSESLDGYLVFGNLQVDPRTFGVTISDQAVDLTFYEFELLSLLCREVDRIVHYETICQTLWSSFGQLERRRLSVMIFRLRAKLSASWPYKVETVRGRGYGFIASKVRPAQA